MFAVTFLKSENHDDSTLRSAATAMRHSSKTQSSGAYDKEHLDRRVEAALRVTERYAARF